GATLLRGSLPFCEPRCGEKLTSGICLDFVGQQVDISDISRLRRVPISQDSLSKLWDSIVTRLRKSSCLNNKILNQFRRQPPANPLQFSIPRAILGPCGMTVVSNRLQHTDR